MRCLRLFVLLSLVWAVVVGARHGQRVFAADEPAGKASVGDKGKGKPAKKTNGEKPLAEEWAELVARQKSLMQEGIELQKQLADADQKAKREIFAKVNRLRSELMQDLRPRMIALAPRVNEQDPTNVDAAEVMMNLAVSENKYQEAVAIAKKVLEADKSSPTLLSILGVARFSMNDFEGARQALEAAREADPEGFAQGGAMFLEDCDKYIEYWKKEQAIRAKEKEADDLPRVLLKTTKGDIVLELFENEAPNTVANFISLVEAKKYDGTLFHRVIPGFMAQGGNLNTADDDPGNDEDESLGYNIACECYTDKARMHFLGSLSMAKQAPRDTGGSQFFITFRPTGHLNWEPEKEANNHTVFGRVTKGLEVALALRGPDPKTGDEGDRIQSAKVLRKRDHEYKPKKLAARKPGAAPRFQSKKKIVEDGDDN